MAAASAALPLLLLLAGSLLAAEATRRLTQFDLVPPCPRARASPYGIFSTVGADGYVYTLYSEPVDAKQLTWQGASDACKDNYSFKGSRMAGYSPEDFSAAERAVLEWLCEGCDCWTNDKHAGDSCGTLYEDRTWDFSTCVTFQYSYVCRGGRAPKTATQAAPAQAPSPAPPLTLASSAQPPPAQPPSSSPAPSPTPETPQGRRTVASQP
ncbi:hypothetical protein HYH03_017052 [Edaphochlamys debaryana]|uniref:Uncharacterized protein n=1 Tax=Edaphochlamys debaryana TaxID=47281 RepID=A0A835XND2_9CHLO|nr:hypothetical protein HYH03_017052 [Edaphochlamys debaryana]|eukprot:KAG2484100.1 hypothetical protein HYH03_017052 [Edaphochlamys debaryana]